MMIKLNQTLAGACLGLLLLPQAGNSQVTPGATTITNKHQSEEERARNYFTDTEVLNFMRLLKSSLKVRDGGLVLPDGEGLCLEWDEEAIRRWSSDGWA